MYAATSVLAEVVNPYLGPAAMLHLMKPKRLDLQHSPEWRTGAGQSGRMQREASFMTVQNAANTPTPIFGADVAEMA